MIKKLIKTNKNTLIEVCTVLIGIVITFCFYGCTLNISPLPKGLFEQKTIFEKPDNVTSVEEINKSYLELFKAYQNNLLLLEYLEKMNNGEK